jgi:peptidyl-prolyl cis-trans isomerase C
MFVKHPWRRAAGLVPLFLLSVSVSGVRAQAPPSPAEPPVIRVGSRALAPEALQRRLDQVPHFQLAALGDSPARIREQYLEQVVIPELLLEEEAARQRLADRPQVRQIQQHILVQALEDEIRRELENKGIGDHEVSAYFEKHRKELDRPETLRLFRLLAKDKATAERLLAQAKHIKDMAKWRELVREHSLEKATRLRGGDLGFVRPDGHTEVPRVRVTSALFQAAATVEDGELVNEPVPDGAHYAIVWRRGMLPARRAELQEEAPRIRRLLIESRLREALTTLLDELAKGKVVRHELTPLEALTVTTPADPRLPATALLQAARPAPAKPAASASETGLR